MQATQPNNELIKHSAAIHINNKLTLVERKVSNILLKHAQHNMDRRDEHVISIKDLCEDLHMPDNKNYDMLKNALRALSQTQLEWNILNKDKKNKWGLSSIIASVEIENGVCRYSYSAALKKIFANPNIYAKLNMAIQASFTSKYSIALWEYIMEFISLSANQRSELIRNQISLENLRKLLGVENSKYYLQFSNFNREILKKAIKEINEISDLEVEVAYIKNNKKVDEIEIVVKRANIKPENVGILGIDTTLPFVQINDERAKTAVILMDEFFFSELDAEKMVNAFDLERINLVLDYTRKNKPLNPTGYIKKALREHWELITDNSPSIQKDDELKFANDSYLNSIEDPIFKNILSELRDVFGEPVFKSWFKGFDSILLTNEDHLVINLNNYTAFTANYLNTNYSHHIMNISRKYYPNITNIKFVEKI